MEEHNELLPCPFCGGEATYHLRDRNEERQLHIVGCGALMDNSGLYGGCLEKDRARSTYSYKSKQEAIKAWNTRYVKASAEKTDNNPAIEWLYERLFTDGVWTGEENEAWYEIIKAKLLGESNE